MWLHYSDSWCVTDQPVVASSSAILRVAIAHEYINEVTDIGRFWLPRNLWSARAVSNPWYVVYNQGGVGQGARASTRNLNFHSSFLPYQPFF